MAIAKRYKPGIPKNCDTCAVKDGKQKKGYRGMRCYIKNMLEPDRIKPCENYERAESN